MGQKTNPVGNRLGIIRGWDSNWFGGKDFAAKVVEDENIRQFIMKSQTKGGIARIVIERTLKRVTVTIHTARPGLVIGKGGKDVDILRGALNKLTKKDVQINIYEIRKPNLDAAIVGEGVAKQLEARINFRRAIKAAIKSTMMDGAEGIKIRISGRLNGADMARSEEFKQGRTPLHTFRADIDYCWQEAHTVYGKIGIKTWICRGELYGKRDLSPISGANAKDAVADGGGNRDGGRRDGGRREGGNRDGGRREGGGNRGGGNGGNRDGGRREGGNGGGRDNNKR
jgi:small subunit ribosomal protein S3